MTDDRSLWNPYTPLSPGQRRGLGFGAVLFLLLLWGAAAALALVGPNKLPAPWKVAEAFVYLAWDAENQRSLLLTATLWSVGRILAAFVLTLAVGIPIGVMMGASPKINAVLSPLIDPFRSAPVVALLPIMVMWFGIGESMKVVFLFIGAVVYLIPMVRDAMQAVPQSHWISARDLGATPWEAVRLAVLPMAMPRIADGVIVATSVMWTYITVAEYVNAREGLGQLIQNARRFSAMDQVFAGIIVIIALALITYQLMQFIKRRLYPWETQQ
ncbi:MAG: binding-protein-dependent transport system inner rane component [Panacagrimonas sp.]|jgi:ABC-type nitrate/sulfonate/bicarbonate transport system permease component|nr:ABC transporter permease [Panacagrimonas sp.]MCC2656530.1 binding-protein-dependent transport system inner rane component [Panacagrimonas sp.]